MKLDTQKLLKQSELFALTAAEKISKISLEPFFEATFHSSEFRDRADLKESLGKIPENDLPLIYIFEIQSLEKVQILVDHFERFQFENKLKLKSSDRVKLSRYNKTLTNILYVGSSTTNFKARIKNHFGTEGNGIYSLHLCKWDNASDYDLKVSALKVISQDGQTVERFIVEILEQHIWDALDPIFGKRSGL